MFSTCGLEGTASAYFMVLIAPDVQNSWMTELGSMLKSPASPRLRGASCIVTDLVQLISPVLAVAVEVGNDGQTATQFLQAQRIWEESPSFLNNETFVAWPVAILLWAVVNPRAPAQVVCENIELHHRQVIGL